MKKSTHTGRLSRFLPRMAAVSAVALISTAALTACSSSDKASDKPGVDSLSGAASSNGAHTGKSSSDAALEEKRPQLRLDTSPEESQRLDDAYNACLEAAGVPMNTERAALSGAKQAPPKQGLGDEYNKAFDSCLVKLPRQPPEMEPESNPAYADDYRAYVKCLRDHGMKVHEVPDTSDTPDGLGWAYDDATESGLPESQTPKVEQDCTVEAFDGKK